MLRLFYVRHGETQWNVDKRIQGQKESPLTQKGILQAKKLADRIKNYDFEIVYSSSSIRAVDTAKLLVNDKKIQIIETDLIRELNFGDWEGKKIQDIIDNYPSDYKILNEKMSDFLAPNGESFNNLSIRALSFLEEMKLKHKDGNILIISHGVFIKATIYAILKKQFEINWRAPHQTSISIIEFNNQPSVISYNDYYHLQISD